MTDTLLDPRIVEELKPILQQRLASGELLTSTQIDQQIGRFRDRFGPAVLRELDGEALLRLMHGRDNAESRSLVYWLEFKNDEDFAGGRFGGIAGGSAMKYGIFQRQSDGAWVTGSPMSQQVLSIEDAIGIARRQRDELVAGDAILSAFDVGDVSDEAYARLQTSMEQAAPELSGTGWAHKYWFLIHQDCLDDYHSPRYQRFHLLKLLQRPPDERGILDGRAPRFVCAGRFVFAARVLDVPIASLTAALNQRDGSMHRYWRIGTTAGDSGETQWPAMREGEFVSVGWLSRDLSAAITLDDAKDQIRDWLLKERSLAPAVASRKAGEVLNFAREIAENDLVLACDGNTVLGIGRVRGAYAYDGTLEFPHKRAVSWLLLEPWSMPYQEGLRTTVYELGRNANNILELERRLFDRKGGGPVRVDPTKETSVPRLPALDAFAERVGSILQRKGQVILYGPPGTGKTYRALRVARELAARHTFRKAFHALTAAEQDRITGPNGLVRLCTFHPGFGYEDFVEGLRPQIRNDQMVFQHSNGIFKRLCEEAAKRPDRFFLVVDEINRGDVPRIFGELITAIEKDKRGIPVVLPVSGSSLTVPDNVCLIGTMNTADRSISLLDAALRRRFGFVELMPDSSQLAGRKAGGLPLAPWLDALNARLRRYLKRDARNLQIGHAYLLPAAPITSLAEFARVLRDDIIPLLEEYCYDDFATLKDILGTALVDAEAGRIREELFAVNREDELLQAVLFEEMEPIALAQGVAVDISPGEDRGADNGNADEDDAPTEAR